MECFSDIWAKDSERKNLDFYQNLWRPLSKVLVTPTTADNATRQLGAFLCPFSKVKIFLDDVLG